MTPRPFWTANSRLSRCASEMAQLRRQEEEAHADVDLVFAPGECHAIVAAGVERSIDETLAKYNYTRQSYNEDLDSRLSPKAVYESHLWVEELQ